MHKLLDLIAGKLRKVSLDDEIMAMDYMTFYGIDDSEAAEYADSFLAECYHLKNPKADLYDQDYGIYEANNADKIPMASRKTGENTVYYSYRGQTVIKLK